MPPGREEHAPRRYFLDGILQDAADAAGATFLDNTRLEDLTRSSESGRVNGIRCAWSGKGIETLQADLVVGADGRHSNVAKLVGAEEYCDYAAPRGAYWAYWEVPPDWRTESWPFQGYFASRDRAIRFCAETNDRQVLIGTAPSVDIVLTWRGNHVDSYEADLRHDHVIASIVAQSKRASDVRGTVHERYFFRRAVGPGWALVGDAGHHKDFVIGDGITQALRDARNLAAVIRLGGSDESLNRYWRERDIEAQPFFRSAEQQADLDPSARLNRLIFGRVGRSPDLIHRFWRQFEHDIDPFEAVPLSIAVKAVLDGLIQGQFGVVKEFLKEGKRISGVQAEGKRLQSLLAQENIGQLPFSSNGESQRRGHLYR
jgi:2-polyprenyl-6-methoxyphenol hydroxylase-like FAD-dependent oxidoreductase